MNSNQNCRSKQSVSSCHSKKANSENRNLFALVAEYLITYKDYYKNEDEWWADRNITWSEAIERAWQSLRENGKMHYHQCRVGKQKLNEGLKICLSDNRQPDSFNDFHHIYCWIESITQSIYRLGHVTAYDVARRLGSWLDMKPEIVYLHAGAAQGAHKLGINGKTAPLSSFPPEIQKLGATHAENFLCIYKNCF